MEALLARMPRHRAASLSYARLLVERNDADAGRRALDAQTTEWRAFAQAVESVLDGPAQAAAPVPTTDDVTAEMGAEQ